jgi:hypothetical protein
MRGLRLILVALLLCAGRGWAQVTLAFVSDPSGITLSGSGTSAASMSFGTVRAFGGTVPSGVSKSTTASSFTLSTTIDVQVQKGVLDSLSPNYTLTAKLQISDLTNTWKFNAITLSTTAATITSTGAYGTTANSFSLTVPFSAAAGAISNTINFTVTSN